MYTTLFGKTITLSSKIAKGGEGEVYNILGDNKNCVKIYHEPIRNKEKEEKLKYMSLNPPQELEGIAYKICWPKDVIYKDDKFVGFLMSKSFDDSLLPYHLCQPVIPDKLGAQWHNTFDRKSFKGISSRLKLSVNIVAIVNRIHKANNYIIVDLKPQNLLITASGKVSIIDVDSVQITENDKVLFKAPVSTPEYTPPEASGVIKNKNAISKDWDTFSLGVLVYEILCGIHPYVGSAKVPFDNLNTIQEKIKINLTHVTKGENVFSKLPPPHKIFNTYSTDLKNIFKKIFNPYNLGITTRPNLDEFGGILFNEVSKIEEELKKEGQRILKQEKNKKKSEEQEAIKNYKTVCNSLDELKTENKTLNNQLEELTNKSNSKTSSWSIIFGIISVILFICFIYQIQSNNTLTDEISKLYLEKSIVVKKPKTVIIEPKKVVKEVVKEVVKKAPIKISSIKFRSSKYGSNFNEFGDVKTVYYLTRSKSYYLHPTITYIGNKSGYYNISIKYIHTRGLLRTSNSTSSYSLVDKQVYFKEGKNTIELKGFGGDSNKWWDYGDHTIEVWIKGKKSFSHIFKITTY